MFALIGSLLGVPTKSKHLHVDGILGVVVDRSGSMVNMQNEVVSGLNLLIEDQKKILSDNARVYIVEFDNEVKDVLVDVTIGKVPLFTTDNFQPRGMTALLDAIKHIVLKLQAVVIDDFPPVVVIMTDGEENCSNAFHSEILELVTSKKNAGWKFTFMGCSSNALEVGKNMGFDQERCLRYQFNGKSQARAWKAVSAQVSRTMSHPNDDASSAFTTVERGSTI
tara:strand:+ start:668 stop:1336 length:669 start_codon:yes stop_codon:yes gene_type:complete